MELERNSVKAATSEVGARPPFVCRVEKELKRAERYLSFISLVVFELGSNKHVWDEEFKKKITKTVERSIRETDIVGVSDTHRLAVLLVETPRFGAERTAERLAVQLAELDPAGKNRGELVVRIHSFPEDPEGKEEFVSTLEQLR